MQPIFSSTKGLLSDQNITSVLSVTNLNGKRISTNLKRSYSLSDSDDCSVEDAQGNYTVTSGSRSTSYRSPPTWSIRETSEGSDQSFPLRTEASRASGLRKFRLCQVGEGRNLADDGRPSQGVACQQGLRYERRVVQNWPAGYVQTCFSVSCIRYVNTKIYMPRL